MNIFALDDNPETCARFHNDSHVKKMILEHAQMMCTAVIYYGGTAPYKPTHRNHPCTLWVQRSAANFMWLKELNYWLNNEYKIRYVTNRDHLAYTKTKNLKIPESFPRIERTPFAQAMPDYCKDANSIEAYKKYYNLEKRHLAVWTNRLPPKWYTGDISINNTVNSKGIPVCRYMITDVQNAVTSSKSLLESTIEMNELNAHALSVMS